MTAECIEWTVSAKRRFLKQALEIVLTKLHIKARQFQDALAVAQPLIRELKRLDDKMQLVEVCPRTFWCAQMCTQSKF